MKPALSILLIVVTIVSLSCQHTTEPELQPGRRDYVWTVDTLEIPQGRSLPSRMWGTSANNIWAVGLAYLNAYCIWHFDGYSWQNYAPDKYIDPTDIWGTSSNNIWIGTTDGVFWHYDGFKWTKFQETIIPNYNQFVVQSICGNGANNIYAVGFADSTDRYHYKGIIMHFNGNKWELVNIPRIEKSFNSIYYDENSGNFIISAWEFDNPNKSIYSFNGNNLKEIYFTQDNVSLNVIGKGVYLVRKKKIYKLQNENFNLFLDFSSLNNYAGATFGKNEKDFFTINWDGIGHYNGIDLITIFAKQNDEWFPDGASVFEKDAFFIWDDSHKTFIVHGKLK